MTKSTHTATARFWNNWSGKHDSHLNLFYYMILSGRTISFLFLFYQLRAVASNSSLFNMLLGFVTTVGMKDPTGLDYSLFLFNREVLPISPHYVLQEMEYFYFMIGNRASSSSVTLHFRQCYEEGAKSHWADYFISSCALYEHSKYIRHENILLQKYF